MTCTSVLSIGVDEVQRCVEYFLCGSKKIRVGVDWARPIDFGFRVDSCVITSFSRDSSHVCTCSGCPECRFPRVASWHDGVGTNPIRPRDVVSSGESPATTVDGQSAAKLQSTLPRPCCSRSSSPQWARRLRLWGLVDFTQRAEDYTVCMCGADGERILIEFLEPLFFRWTIKLATNTQDQHQADTKRTDLRTLQR